MKKVLVATVKPFAPAAVEKIRGIVEKEGFEFALLEKYSSQEDLHAAVADAEALIVRSDQVDQAVVDAARALKIVVRAGAGYDNLDLEAASAKKIVAMNTPGQNANAVAELAMGMMVFMARNQFNGKAGTELLGKTLGIHAYGNVGRHVARIARGFGMECLSFDPYISRAEIEKDGMKAVQSAAELYSRCRYVSLHMPANDETRQSVGYELCAAMPEGAVLINTARKEVIDESGLLKVLQARDDFRYASDIAPDLPELSASEWADRCYYTPRKMGAQTAEANINAGVAAARQIVAFFREGDTRFQVN